MTPRRPPTRAQTRTLPKLPDDPDTYEKLVAQIARQHPEWTRAAVERWIAEHAR